MIIKKGTLLYHGTIYNFEPTEINTPCWFSTIKEQAILHVCYKHYNNPNGMLMIYRLNQDINAVDLTLSGNERLFVNAYGNYALADNIKSEGIYQGYINFPEQSEIMLVNNGLFDFVKQNAICLHKKVKYLQVDNDWRMVEDVQLDIEEDPPALKDNEVVIKKSNRCKIFCCFF